MEKIDVYDKMKNKTGKIIERGTPLEEGEYHLVVHIWIKNAKGQFLIQKRADTVKLLPNIWASTGGSVISGENSEEAIIREVKEEIGLPVLKENLKKLFTRNYENRIWDVFFTETEADAEHLALQKQEVCAVKWAYPDEIMEMIEKNEFFKYNYIEEIL